MTQVHVGAYATGMVLARIEMQTFVIPMVEKYIYAQQRRISESWALCRRFEERYAMLLHPLCTI